MSEGACISTIRVQILRNGCGFVEWAVDFACRLRTQLLILAGRLRCVLNHAQLPPCLPRRQLR